MRRLWSCGCWRKRGRIHRVAAPGGIGPEMLLSSGADGRVCGPGDAQFVNAITVDLPSLTTESNQHCDGNSSV